MTFFIKFITSSALLLAAILGFKFINTLNRAIDMYEQRMLAQTAAILEVAAGSYLKTADKYCDVGKDLHLNRDTGWINCK